MSATFTYVSFNSHSILCCLLTYVLEYMHECDIHKQIYKSGVHISVHTKVVSYVVLSFYLSL